jgi:hypothetical protein
MLMVLALLAGGCDEPQGPGPLQGPIRAQPPAEAADPRFQLRFGTPRSPTDAELVAFPEKLTPGYVGYKLSTTLDQFPIKRIRNTLFALDGGGRQQLTRSETSLEGDINVFYKSWHLPDDGSYEVRIEDVSTGKLVAVGRFRVER